MEKVKLTQEQAEAIEKLKRQHKGNVFDAIEDHSNVLADANNEWVGKYSPLNEMTVAEVAQILVNGYEVEEMFEVGEWVMHKLSKWIGEVTRVYEDALDVLRLGNEYVWNKKYVRHATPEEIAEEKQRRWWAKHGRDVYEFKAGDLIKCEDTTSEVESPEEDLIWIKMNGAKGTLPEKIYQGIEVICFAEDRKDLEA